MNMKQIIVSEIRYIKAMSKFKKLDSFYNSLVNSAKYNVNFIFKHRHNKDLVELYKKYGTITLDK